MFCPHCGKEINENQAFCQHCGARLAAEESSQRAAGGRSITPWENREQYGAFRGFILTLQGALATPAEFFKKMPVSGGLIDPLLFAMIAGMFGLTFLSVWDVVLHDSMRNLLTSEMKAVAERGGSSGAITPVSAVLMPFLLVLWLFIVSGMFHLFLIIVRGAKAGFEATFRVVSYSAALFPLMIIPYCGIAVAALWGLTLIAIGLRDAHETTGGKALAAVFLPLLFCCGAAALTAVVFMGALAASFGAMLQH